MAHDTSLTKSTSVDPIDDAIVEEIANEADTDSRSVVRRLAGLPVRGRAGVRIDRVLATRRASRAHHAA